MSKREKTKSRPSGSTSTVSRPSVGTRAFKRRAQDQRRREIQRRNARARTRGAAKPGRLEIPAALRKVPLAAWVCAAIALLSAASWSIITPPFQVTDETDHYAYVKQLAETGQLPVNSLESELSSEEEAAMSGLSQQFVRENPAVHPIATREEEAHLQQLLDGSYSETGEQGGAGVAAAEPPLYYAAQAVVYTIAGGTVLNRLASMRLFSALIGSLAALFVFLFVREALPGVRWAWTIGGLGAAFTPLFGFMSSGVNPDVMLIAVVSAAFYLLARGFRRGLTMRLGVALGATLAAGLLTKLTFVGVAPGIIVGATRSARLAFRSASRPSP
jgi:hypothetical protein